ncbi:MAG: acyltransferase [Vicinamibacterales bacterium]
MPTPPPSPGATPLSHLPQLDALRTLAVAGVMVYHFTNGRLGDAAYYGVRLFFVLSGFLITRLLLDARARLDAGGTTFGGALERFYIRRTLRIFPLYYVAVLGAALVNLEPARELLPWLLSYTVNVKYARQGYFDAHFAHFWSLCVEEQFYLVWPWVVLLAPVRALPALTLGMVALGPASRTWLLGRAGGDIASYVLMPASCDALGIGALLALTQAPSVAGGLAGRLLGSLMAAVRRPLGCLASTVAAGLAIAGYAGAAGDLVHGLATSMVFAGMVGAAAAGFRGVTGRVCEARPVRYVGKISYGVYVYHPLLLAVAPWLQRGQNDGGLAAMVAGFAAFGALTIAIASASWYSFEKPLNDLKARV